MLWNLALNLLNDSLSISSNNKVSNNFSKAGPREAEMVHKLKEPMDIEKQNSPLS
jgi:hypothetical protein